MGKEEIRGVLPQLLVNRVIWSLPLKIGKVFSQEVNRCITEHTLGLTDEEKVIIDQSLHALVQIWGGVYEDEQGEVKERLLTLIERFYPLHDYLDDLAWDRLTEMILDSKYRKSIIKGLSQYLTAQENDVLALHANELPTSLSQWYIRCNQLIRYLSLYQED